MWLDSTPGVAPFGYLMPNIRGKLALVTSPEKGSALRRIPNELPTPTFYGISLEGQLTDERRLDVLLTFETRGDWEVLLRLGLVQSSVSQLQSVLEAGAKKEAGSADLAISDAHAGRLADFHAELAGQYGASRVWATPCDVTSEDQVQALINGAVGQFGHIDVMINNAGLGGTVSVLDMTDEQWSRVLDVTLNGTFRCTRAALRQLVSQGRGGAVVNNASVLGWRAQPGQAHYAAAKAGVMALTRCAALDVAEHGIRVNAVAPSLAMHPFLAKVMAQEVLDELVTKEAFGRSAEPWEVANVMVFLASDYASYLTGEVISVSNQHP